MAAPRPAAGALALAALLLLAAPLAAAAQAEGDFRALRASAEGPVAFEATAAALRWTGEAAPALDVSAASVHIERIWFRSQRAGDLAQFISTPYAESADHTNARLRLTDGAIDALLALRTDRPLAATLAGADLRPAAHASIAEAYDTRDCRPEEAYCWDVRGVTEARTLRADVVLPDELRILLHGPTLVVQDARGEKRYASGLVEREEGATTVREDAWVLVVVTGAAGTLVMDGDVAVYAASPTLRAPRVALDAASGRLDVGLRAYVADAERVVIDGDLLVRPGPVAPVEAHGAEPVTYGSTLDAQVRGDVRAVSLSAVPIYASSPAATAGILALLLAAAAALAYAWPLVQFHATSAMLPLYTRLKPPRLLDNHARKAIYEIIRANPGISARNVHRLSDQSWGTVVYHLRQLEKHDLVVSRALGRTRNYYENHGKYRGMEVQLACLRSERARVLARLVLAAPGVSQEELATRSGYPQPTTSYYVRKLKSAGLVEERRDGRYARYRPVGDVAKFLELAERDELPAPAATPV